MKKNRGIKAGRSYNKRHNKQKQRKERIKRQEQRAAGAERRRWF